MEVKIEKGVGVIFDKSPTDEDYIKAQELIDNTLYPTEHCRAGTCRCCGELQWSLFNGCLKRYTCKKKDITILSNIMPKPENFVKAFEKETI